jgi:hypothetical protein
MSRDDSHVLAQSVHDLGSALWFGGSVMGVAGVNKSGNDLRDGLDKVRVAESAWQRFAPVQWAGIAAVLVAGSTLSAASKGRLAAQQGYARAGSVKAGVAVAGALASGFAAYSGKRIGDLTEQAASAGRRLDVQDASTPNAHTPPEVASWQKRQRAAQYLVPLLSGANVVLNSYLVQSYRPGAAARGVAGRLLPG